MPLQRFTFREKERKREDKETQEKEDTRQIERERGREREREPIDAAHEAFMTQEIKGDPKPTSRERCVKCLLETMCVCVCVWA